MARLAALVPPPRMHLMRYHGVFAPHSKLRAAVTPAGRGKGSKPQAEEGAEKPATPRHVAMSWDKRLKRVFGVDIEGCARYGGKLKVIASIEEPAGGQEGFLAAGFTGRGQAMAGSGTP